MNRRSFLQTLGLVAIGTTVFGKLVPVEPPKPKYRKLRAVWTVDLEQDLRAVHSMDAEEELAKMIQEEIDRVVLEELRALAT